MAQRKDPPPGEPASSPAEPDRVPAAREGGLEATQDFKHPPPPATVHLTPKCII